MNTRILWILQNIKDAALAPLVCLMPRNKKKILFGAWAGRQFSDNPKYFLFAIQKFCPQMKCYWVGEAHLAPILAQVPNVTFVRKGSLCALWHQLTAKYYVCNINYREEIGNLSTCRRVTIINLWHGIPYKHIGNRQFNGNGQAWTFVNERGRIRSFVRSLYLYWYEWLYPQTSWTSVSSQKMGDIFCESFPKRFSKERMVMAGLPRNDFLVQNKGNEALKLQIKQKYALLLNLSLEKKWYLYLPTWRHGEGSAFSFMTSDNREKYQEMLQAQEAILIEKQHPIVLKRLNLAGQSQGNLFALSVEQSAQIDLQELLLVSDRLITDYSSCFFDFALLDRPCIHFAYDFEEYTQKDSGVEYDLREIAVGPIVETERDLLATMRFSDEEILSKRASKWQEPISNETGQASEILLKEMGL